MMTLSNSDEPSRTNVVGALAEPKTHTPRLVKVPFANIDLTDTRFRFRKSFNVEALERKAASIRNSGLLNPPKLWRIGTRYVVIAGWQRIIALRNLKSDRVLASVYEGLSYRDAIRINITDNLHQGLSDFEIASQMRVLRETENLPVEKIAEIFACSVDRVYDLLSIFSMDTELRDVVEKDDLGLYKAVVLSRFPSSERSEYLVKTLSEGRSVKWLRSELAKLKLHPFLEKPVIRPGSNVVVHAFRFPLDTETHDVWDAHWSLIGKGFGLPAPMKCEVTMSSPARSCSPPYVCQNDIEAVVLSFKRLSNGDQRDWNWEEVPLHERDGWFFLCRRCARLMFPGIVFHKDYYSPKIG
jgi:ParB-like chromosome segregation protein Spo0J